MQEPHAALGLACREARRSWAKTVVGGCLAGLLLAGSCAGAETLARQASGPPESDIQDGAVRPGEDWASAMAGVPLDPAQWPSALPPGAAPQQKPDPTGLVLAPIADRFPLECDWFLQDWAPRSPADWWLASDRRAASLTLFERAVRELPDDRAAAFHQTLRSAGEATVESVLRLVQQVGHERWQQRLAALFARCPRIVFTKFRDEGQGYAPRPAVSDGRGGGFAPGGALCLLYGPGLAGVRRGAIQRLRVVALDYRAAAIGMGQTNGPAGGVWNVRTPVAINGTWDVKRVLGEVPVAADGSACFEVPARTPVYFQALDERGFMVQSMRSWTVLQPGETVSCVGCHEGKNEAPRLSTVPDGRTGRTADIRLPPAESVPGFSFIREVQPILDRHCISCHRGRRYAGPEDDVKPTVVPAKGEPSWSLLGRVETETATGRQWSDAYVGLIRAHRSHSIRVGQTIVLMAWPGPLVNWISPQSVPEQFPPYSAGAARSGLIDLLQKGHEEVSLTNDEIRTLALWIDLGVPYCGDYAEANAWSPAERQWYEYNQQKRALGQALGSMPCQDDCPLHGK